MATGDGRRGGRVGELKVELVLVVPLRKEIEERVRRVPRGEEKREETKWAARTHRGGRKRRNTAAGGRDSDEQIRRAGCAI